MKKRKDGRWLKIKTIDGMRISFYSTEDTEKAAIRDIENQMMAYAQKKHNEKHNFKMLSEKMLEHQRQSITYNTAESYSHSLKHLSLFYDYDIEDITPSMVQSLLDTMVKKQGYSFSTVSKTKIVLSLVFDYAIIFEDIKLNNFMKSVKIPKGAKKGKITSPGDTTTKVIIENAEKIEFGMWAMCLLCTGLRRGELAALQKKDVDFISNTIDINKAVEFIVNQPNIKNVPKTDESIGTVPIIKILKSPLKRLCADLSDNDYIFGKEKPLTKTQIDKRWKKYCETIGHSFNGHQLRHAYAKLIYEAGIDVKTAQRLLRHADFATTMNIYTEFSKSMTEKSIEKLNKYLTNF